MLGQAGKAVSVTIKSSKERFGENSFKFDSIQSSFVFSLCLEGMFHRAVKVKLKIPNKPEGFIEKNRKKYSTNTNDFFNTNFHLMHITRFFNWRVWCKTDIASKSSL